MESKLYFKKRSDKGSGELKIEKVYNTYLKYFIKLLGVKSTYDYQLYDIAKIIYGSKFIGVFPKNDIDKYKNIKNKQSAIINTDLHWVSIYKDGDTLIIYDSFGRPYKELFGQGTGILNKHFPKIMDTEHDVEQKDLSSETCGQRCLAWISCVYTVGIKPSMLI
jgi:hypothetical protein